MARLALLVTGASGMRLPLHALSRLTAEEEVERLHLVISSGARRVLELEALVFLVGERRVRETGVAFSAGLLSAPSELPSESPPFAAAARSVASVSL